MEFEELQVIWDQQEEKAMYAINEQALQSMVRRRGRSVERRFQALDYFLLANWVFLVWVTVADPLLHGTGYGRLWTVVFPLACIVFWMLAVRQRREKFSVYQPTLRGDLDRAIAMLDQHLAFQTGLVKWLFPPLVVWSALWASWQFEPGTLWIWPVVIAVGCLLWWVAWRDLQRQLARRRELAGLREKLTREE